MPNPVVRNDAHALAHRIVRADRHQFPGHYFADQRLTVADLKIFMWVRWLRAGVLDHIPKDLVDRVAPLLVKHSERVASHPGVAEYYRRRKAA